MKKYEVSFQHGVSAAFFDEVGDALLSTVPVSKDDEEEVLVLWVYDSDEDRVLVLLAAYEFVGAVMNYRRVFD